jgi:hypothetical protein
VYFGDNGSLVRAAVNEMVNKTARSLNSDKSEEKETDDLVSAVVVGKLFDMLVFKSQRLVRLLTRYLLLHFD